MQFRKKNTHVKRDLAIALSLANLCYVRVWSELLTYKRADTYLMKHPPAPASFAAVIANVLVLAAILWGAATLARRLGPRYFRIAEIGFLLSLVVPLNGIRSVLSNQFPYLKSPLFALIGTGGVLLLGVFIGLSGLAVIVFWRRRAAHLAAGVMAALVPFAAITFGQAVWKTAAYNAREFTPRPAAARLPVDPGKPRFLWLICDEWDYRLTFVDRNPALRLPAIDRIRGEFLAASHAHPPGPETPISMPAYTTGKLVRGVEYRGPAELQVYFRDSTVQRWGAQPTVFSRARELGFNTAVIGWFHPYCRVLDGLTYCDWREMAMQHNSMGETFGEILPHQTRSLFETSLLSAFGQGLPVRQQAETYQAILREGEALASDPGYGLVFVHLPVPHAPHAYDRRTGRLTLANSPVRGYLDSLALLDRTLAELRASMEKSGAWEKTNILISSDHHYREDELLDGKSDERIPFLLKLAGQKQGLAYDPPFNAVLTHDLVLSVLRGEITTPAAAAAWLDRNRSREPVN
jgi:Sulfatase